MVPQTTQFPRDEILYLIPILRGQVPADKLRAVHSGLVVCDYSAYLTMAGSDFETSDTTTCESLADFLESQAGVPGVVSAQAIPWGSVMKFLLPLLIEWLRK